MVTEIIDSILPITKEDKECFQKMLIKNVNREKIQKLIEKMKSDPYCNIKIIFEPTHLSDDKR